jgi:hypothetical protein
MNTRTTRESAFSASASENGLPSIVVRENAGAAAPTVGESARAGPAAPGHIRAGQIRTRQVDDELLPR